MPTRSVAIIGGGIIGISIARECAKAGYEVALFEKELLFGSGQSTHNSGIRHSGLLYSRRSLKARLCVQGGRMLDAFCRQYSIPYLQTGKLVVAHTEEENRLLDLYEAQGKMNGVRGLQKISEKVLHDFEPNVAGIAALYSPETAVFDAGAFLKKIVYLAKADGAYLFEGRGVTGVGKLPSRTGFVLHIQNADLSKDEWNAEWVINAAGVHADAVARMINAEASFRVLPARGEYYKYRFFGKPRIAIRRCIYGLSYASAMPDGRWIMSSGMHCAPTVVQNPAGEFWQSDTVLVGPTVKVMNKKDDYESDRFPVSYFYEWARRMLPKIREADLEPDFAGIRAEFSGCDDFVVYPDPIFPHFLNLFGFRSPALTASLAIGQYVAQKFLR